eukprot:scaffold36953_cov70-Attheya_sp.AAC.3
MKNPGEAILRISNLSGTDIFLVVLLDFIEPNFADDLGVNNNFLGSTLGCIFLNVKVGAKGGVAWYLKTLSAECLTENWVVEDARLNSIFTRVSNASQRDHI